MDLRETPHTLVSRHPWELARAKVLRKIGEAYGAIPTAARVLDLGCGDGFLIDALCFDSAGTIDAVDIHLTVEQISAFALARPRLTFHNSERSLVGNGYGLITMFDVLEHVDDDVAFVRQTMARFAAPRGRFFCTVPAFQALFSSHDTFLRHHRRYSLQELRQVLDRAGLRVIGGGYLFSLLLPARAATRLVEKLFGTTNPDPGIGHWCHGHLLTAVIATLLEIDNCLLLALSRLGISIPGLTAWALCERQR